MAKTNRKNSKKADLRQTVFIRFTFIVAILVLWMGGIGVRLVYLQVKQHEFLKERAMGQRREVKKTRLPRGTIFDRNERALAISVNVKTLYADPMRIDDIPAASKAVAKAAKLKESDVAKLLSSAKADERRYVPLAKGLDELEVQRINKELDTAAVKKADLPRYEGLYWREDQRRSYPHESLAAHVIGFSNADGEGQAGIEQSQNRLLYGAVIKKTQERDRLGRVYDEQVSEKEPSNDVVLTISTSIQYKVEQALAKAVRNSNARSGMAVILDPRSGEVLAMANYPTFDPNKLQEITHDNLRNQAIQSVYAPGSVFKLITYGSALERNLITPDGMIDSGNGTIEVAKHRFTDSHAIGRVTYSKALAHSSNVCAIKTSALAGRESFYGMIKELGFGSRTGIELPAETQGIVRPPDRWNGDSMASMSIGYEIGVSALQMTSAFATIANNGVRIQPHIIKEIRRSDDEVIASAQPEKEQAVKPETARDLKRMLREVVTNGTGKRARLDGYTSAGKTGTAWKFDEKLKRVNSAKYISSFIGFAPAEDPVVTIGVVIDEPKAGGRDGGQAAGPVFKEIAEQILPELGVKPEGAVQTAAEPEPAEEIEETVGNGQPETTANEVDLTAPEKPTEAEKAPSGNKKAAAEPKPTVDVPKERPAAAGSKDKDRSEKEKKVPGRPPTLPEKARPMPKKTTGTVKGKT